MTAPELTLAALPPEPPRRDRRGLAGRLGGGRWLAVFGVGSAALLVIGLVFGGVDPIAGPTGLALLALAAACGALVLGSPMTALLFLIFRRSPGWPSRSRRCRRS
jgi:hypothetical protein